MSEAINIYCDESCHLHNPSNPVMVLGGVWCPRSKAHSISRRLRELKEQFQLRSEYELKWVNVSPARLDYYQAVVSLFFNEPDLHFRAVVIPDKGQLDHEVFNQTPEDFFYKVYYLLLFPMLSPDSKYVTLADATYRVFLDYKDTQCHRRAAELGTVLRGALPSYPSNLVELIQAVKSHEVEALQLTDLLIGAVAYANRRLSSSIAKAEIVTEIQRLSRQDLVSSTPLSQKKLNVFVFTPTEVGK